MLPEKFQCSNCYSRTLSPGWPACPVLCLVSLLPDGVGCSATLEQTPLGGTHAEVGLKPQLSPRGYVTREEELKSLLEGVWTAELRLCRWLPKFITCKTPKGSKCCCSCGGSALAAVGPVGTYAQRLSQAKLWAGYSSHSRSRCMNTTVLRPEVNVYELVAWWKQHLRVTGPTDSTPTVSYTGAKTSANNSVLCEPTP